MGMMDRPLYFDRQGQPIELMDWARKMEDDTYRLVAQDMVGAYWVSTIWIGLDTGLGWIDGSPPIIFETAVFTEHTEVVDGLGLARRESVDGTRYQTEAQAIHGHDQIVARYRSRVSG